MAFAHNVSDLDPTALGRRTDPRQSKSSNFDTLIGTLRVAVRRAARIARQRLLTHRPEPPGLDGEPLDAFQSVRLVVDHSTQAAKKEAEQSISQRETRLGHLRPETTSRNSLQDQLRVSK